MNNQPIGIFDSGIGGLTVTKAILETLPRESIIYLGDTARVPYGTRGKEVITKFALELAKFLLKKNVKLLVVACNTISAVCIDELQQLSPVPVLGVIKPAAEEATRVTQTNVVGVIGTRATIGSGVYEREILALNQAITVLSESCPLFVPIAEEGLGNADIARLMTHEYLAPFKTTAVDTLILGCTHYPLLRAVIEETMGSNVRLIDSASPTAQALKRLLEERDIAGENASPTHEFYVTDAPARLYEVANLFFGNHIAEKIRKVVL